MPFGDNAAEDFVLGQTTAFGADIGKTYKKSTQKKRQRDLMNYMAERGRQQQISNTSLPTTYDPNIVDEKEVRLVSGGRGQKPYNAVVSKQDPLSRDWNMLKDTVTFAAKDPKTFGDILRLSLVQSPVKTVGRIGEATWARGNNNYQNDLSNQFFDSYMNADTMNFQDNNKVKTGSYDDMMKRIEAFQEHKDILGSMKPDFTSDFTFGDAADTASWLIPGPGIISKSVKGAVKGGAAVGKGVKDMRTALAAAKASGFAGDVSSGFKMGLGMAGGLGTGGVGSVPYGLAKNVNKTRAANSVRNTEPYSVVLSPEEVNRAKSGSPIGIPMEASSESRGLATQEEYARLSPDDRAIEDSLRKINRQVWGKSRGLNEPPTRYQVQDYPTVENVTEVITKNPKRYGKLSTKQIEALHKSIEDYIEATPGAKWRIGNRQGLDIHHMDPYASSGVGDPSKLAPLQSTMNRYIRNKPMNIWYEEQVNNGVINVWKDIAPELIASIEAAL